jgi:hypothetical protein
MPERKPNAVVQAVPVILIGLKIVRDATNSQWLSLMVTVLIIAGLSLPYAVIAGLSPYDDPDDASKAS